MGKEEDKVCQHKDDAPAKELVEEVVGDTCARHSQHIRYAAAHLCRGLRLARGGEEALVTAPREEEVNESDDDEDTAGCYSQADDGGDTAVADVPRQPFSDSFQGGVDVPPLVSLDAARRTRGLLAVLPDVLPI